jgi:hypothetical protein
MVSERQTATAHRKPELAAPKSSQRAAIAPPLNRAASGTGLFVVPKRGVAPTEPPPNSDQPTLARLLAAWDQRPDPSARTPRPFIATPTKRAPNSDQPTLARLLAAWDQRDAGRLILGPSVRTPLRAA